MSYKKTLFIIGYWHSELEPEFPHPEKFIDENWDPLIREKIILYLKNAPLMPPVSKGVSWCRFNCRNISNGSREHTDGKYVWPEGLAHYLEAHQVRLPDEIVEHMLLQKALKNDFDPSGAEFNYEWWIGQKKI